MKRIWNDIGSSSLFAPVQSILRSHLSLEMAKAMKAMRAMKAKKPVSARLAKRHAFFGKINKTATGLKKTDLVKNKAGRIVSRKRSALGKKNTWIVAVNKARAFLKIKGFAVVKKGTPLYKKAKEFMA